MATNKVVYFGQVLIDLTEDTVNSEHLLEGSVAHDASGEEIVGTFFNRDLTPIIRDYEPGYINTNTWTYQNSVNNHSDVYLVQEGHQYTLKLGSVVGTRFRSVILTTNPVGSMVNITGTSIINKNNPSAHDSVTFTAGTDGWLVITKDNVGTTGLKSWLFDITTE